MTEIDATTNDKNDTPKMGSALSSLRDELKKKINNEPVVYTVLTRPTISIRYNTNIESGLVQMWRKRSTDKTLPDSFDQLKFSCIVLANQAEMIYVDGIETFGESNELPMTFANPEIMEMFHVAKATEAVKAMYGLDGHILQVVEKLFSAAGYDPEDDIEEDSFLEK